MADLFTQGDWVVQPAKWQGDSRIIWCGPFMIGSTANDPSVIPLGEQVANAKLMAAAPKLLKACRKALEFISNGVELGYIQLPTEGDSALLTAPLLRDAIWEAVPV